MNETGKPLSDDELLKKCGTSEPITTIDMGVSPIEDGGINATKEGINVLDLSKKSKSLKSEVDAKTEILQKANEKLSQENENLFEKCNLLEDRVNDLEEAFRKYKWNMVWCFIMAYLGIILLMIDVCGLQ